MCNPLDVISEAKSMAREVIANERDLPHELYSLAHAPDSLLMAALTNHYCTELMEQSESLTELSSATVEHSLRWDEHLTLDPAA